MLAVLAQEAGYARARVGILALCAAAVVFTRSRQAFVDVIGTVLAQEAGYARACVFPNTRLAGRPVLTRARRALILVDLTVVTFKTICAAT